MKLQNHFEKLVENISLDPTRIGRVRSAVKNLAEFFREDEVIRQLLIEEFLQGSFPMDICVRPQGRGGEFDVDLVLVLRLKNPDGSLPSPQTVLELIAARLATRADFKPKIQRNKPRCIRLQYAGDFHIDIVPAQVGFDTESAIKIPDKQAQKWRDTHPKGFIKAIESKDQNGHLKPVVKMVKWWRDVACQDGGAPKSVVLTTLLANSLIADSFSYAVSLTSTIRQLNRYFQSNSLCPVVANPALPSENLARNWSQEDYARFKKEFAAATKVAEEALAEPDYEKSVEGWQRLFGSAFPMGLEQEAVDFARASRSGNLLVSPQGMLSTGAVVSGATRVVPHRFYGD
jgi:hypothetical protein